MNYTLLNGNTLAYMGDVVWSLYIREYLINIGETKAYILQKKTIKYVSAKGQSKVMYELINKELLNDDEYNIYKRGRNAKVNNVPRNSDLKTYQQATGFESLIGYLYLNNNHDKIKEIFELAKQVIEV